MTTVLDIVNGSAEKLGVKSAESALEAGDFQVILNELNDMLSIWADRGLTPAFKVVTDSTDVVDIELSAVSAVKNNLAIQIAPTFQRVVQPSLALIASTTLQQLEASTDFIGEIAYPDTLPTGSGNDCADVAVDRRFFTQNKKETF